MWNMRNLDLETAEAIALEVLNRTAFEESASQSLLYRRIVAAALEGIRAERERLAQWVVNDTHSVLCRGTARELQESIREMEGDRPATSLPGASV
jgi:hypothetical protein